MRIVLFLAVVFGLVLTAPASVQAAPATVQMEICTGGQAPLTAQQDWARSLARAGIENIQFRAVQPEDDLKIENRGTADRPIYRVTAMLMPNGELIVRGARFRAGEAGRVASWLADLARVGPTLGEKKAAFGLAVSQFEQVYQDLATPVGGLTKDRSRRSVVEQIQGRLRLPLRITSEQLQPLQDQKLTTELSGLSCGTVLALVLRASGLGLVPTAGNGGKLEYRVVSAQRGDEVWPVGTPAPTPLQQTLPTLFEFHNINLQDVPLSTVLAAVEERLQAPILLDENALTRAQIDPEQIKTNHPQRRTAYNLLLQKVLGPAKLKYELRVDEAGKPFVWITTLRPA